jgi:CHAD domain-containing protein
VSGTTEHREVERKFDAETGTALPDLVSVPGVGREGQPVVTRLEATYLDTAQLDLARHRVTLRRRTGGEDEGWHLKLPVGADERLELREPLGESSATPPAALTDEVRALFRDRPLGPVAVLRTERTEHPLLDVHGGVLAVLADDVVQAEQRLGVSVMVSTWREVEVELVAGDRDLLTSIGAALVAGGLPASASASKLARVLDVPPPPSASLPPDSAAALVVEHLRSQVDELLARDRDVRHGSPDAVHKMRVASRRLRSALATFRPLFDRSVTDPVRDELRWLGAALGGARDAEVQGARLTASLDQVPADLVLGPVRRRIALELQATQRAAGAVLDDTLLDPRYFALLDRLDALVDDPPLTETAPAAATDAVPALVARAVRRVRRLARETEPVDADRDHQLHEVRKAAKRARYAAEAAVPVGGQLAKRLAVRMEDLQEVLGEHQDAVTSQAVLRDLGVAAYAAGENGFTFGLLLGHEVAAASEAEARYPRALRRATRPRLLRWTAG